MWRCEALKRWAQIMSQRLCAEDMTRAQSLCGGPLARGAVGQDACMRQRQPRVERELYLSYGHRNEGAGGASVERGV